MKVTNVQEMGDNVYTFTGELNETEHSIVLSYGLNALMSLGLMATAVPSMDVQVSEIPDEKTAH